MKKNIKTWGKVAVFLCACVPVFLSSAYYAQTQGVCLKAGRVLSKEELRKAVLASLVNDRIERAFQYNRENGDVVLGINSPSQVIDLQDLRELIEASYNNEKSFEENFGLKILLNGRAQKKYNRFRPEQVREPFIVVTFEPNKNGDYAAIFFSNHREIMFSDLKPEIQDVAKKKMTWYNKFLGYGNHYFVFSPSFHIIEYQCCDNRNSNDSEYFQRKKTSYDRSVEMVDSFESTVRATSNCGTFLLSKYGDIANLADPDDDKDKRQEAP